MTRLFYAKITNVFWGIFRQQHQQLPAFFINFSYYMYNEYGICWNVTKWVMVIWLGTRAVTGNFQTFFMKVNERLWSWVHTAHHDYFSFVTHTGHNDSPLSITWAHTAHHDYHSFVTHTGHNDFPLSITWAHTVNHDYVSFVSHIGHNDCPLSLTWTHPPPHDPFLLLSAQGITILLFF